MTRRHNAIQKLFAAVSVSRPLRLVKRTAKKIARWARSLTLRRRILYALTAGVILLATIIPTVQYLIESHRYTLDDATLKLVGKSNPNLAAKLTYDRQNSQWQFNKDVIATASTTKSADPAKNIPAALKAQVGGGGKDDESLYAINFPTNPRKGVTVYDAGTDLSFTITPQFKVHGGKATDDGRLVYPMANGAQLIYTPKNNGMKEDIVLPKFIGKELTFSYKLDLPDTLAARVQADGSVGIFSIDPSLLGTVSTSSDADAEKLKSAREHAEKSHLLFAIPAPVIVQTGDKPVKATARFGLADNVLTVTARNMDTAQYPLSVDPSVVVTSSSDFQLGGNNEDNINYGTDQIGRTATTGGSIGAYATTASGSYTARYLTTSVAYNGYLYVIGGDTYNAVDYAPINSDGTVGTWASTTDIGSDRAYPGAVAYNGYMYVFGGYTSGSTPRGDVMYAPINSNGTLGSWTTSSNSMATASCRFGFAVYNGYLYAVGGATGTVASTCGNSSATVTNTTQYAPIKANGDVGAWSTSAVTFTNARMSPGVVAYDGRLYLTGGTLNGSTSYSTTHYASIKTNGDINSWAAASNNLANTKYRFGMTVYNGYLYVSGGSSVDTATYYAEIDADGNIGPWTATSSMSTGRYGHGLVSYKGYLYYTAGVSSTPTLLNDTGYAKIDNPGASTTYTTSGNTFTTTRRGGQTVVYGNYIYVLGGDNGSTPVNTVYKASIANDGTIGTFTSTTAFTTVRTYFAAVAYGGYMYVLGGCSSAYNSCTTAANDLTTVYKSAINISDGTLGTWSAEGSITTARYGLTAVAYNGYMYVMGGLNGSTFNNTIQYHAITANTGAMSGAWTTSAKTLPASSAYVAATVYGGTLYVAGGCSAGALTCTTSRNTVHYAALGTSGDLSATLASTSAFATARGDFGLTAVNGSLYLTGGRTNTTYYDDTQSAVVNSDRTLASWSAMSGSTLATTRYGIGMVSAYGNLYVTGGYNGTTYYNNVQIARVNNGGGGNVDSWQTDSTGTIGTARGQNQTLAYNGYLYVLGGYASGGASLNSVEYAAINSDGTVGSWQTTSSFSNGRRMFTSAVYNGYMYILGGVDSGTYYKDIQYARINSDGSLGSWASAGSNVFNGGAGACMAAYNGYIYSLMGWDGSTDHNSVRYAAINANGTIGSWQTGPSFSNGRSNGNCVAYGGYLYMMGGEDSVGKDDVQYAAINANGSLGSWAYTTSYHQGRANQAAFAYNGYMYIAAGVDSTANNNDRNDMQYAAINSNGTLGQWQHSSALTGDGYEDIVPYNGYIYMPAQEIENTTDYASLNVINRKGTYSKLVDLGTNGKVTGITYGGTLSGGTAQINYRIAGVDGIFGALYNVQRPPSPEGPCIGTYGSGRYAWVSLTLDDSYTGTTANITDISVIYESVHPATNIRLHGGKTLQSGTLSALDTCGMYS